MELVAALRAVTGNRCVCMAADEFDSAVVYSVFSEHGLNSQLKIIKQSCTRLGIGRVIDVAEDDTDPVTDCVIIVLHMKGFELADLMIRKVGSPPGQEHHVLWLSTGNTYQLIRAVEGLSTQRSFHRPSR